MPTRHKPKAKPSQTVRTHPVLWERSKVDAVRRMGGKFSARAMQLAVKLYKARGGSYKGRKPAPKRNALMRWTVEDWGYVGAAGRSRYLPKKVRDKLTPVEKRKTSRAKNAASKQWSKQPADVAKKAARIRKAMWAK
jgi:hypothetical protein